MKVSTVLAFVSTLATSSAITFDRLQRPVFIVRGGSRKGAGDKTEEAEREHKTIVQAIQKAEERVQKAVSTELDALFHRKEHDEKKAEVAEKASTVVKKGAEKAKEAADQHTPELFFPYEWPHYHEMHPMLKKNQEPGEPREHRVLDAVEAAEKAVLHAVEAEVDTIFHELKHHDDKEVAKKAEDTAKKTKHVVEKGVKKATKKVEDTHEHRRRWLGHEVTTHHIDDYLNTYME